MLSCWNHSVTFPSPSKAGINYWSLKSSQICQTAVCVTRLYGPPVYGPKDLDMSGHGLSTLQGSLCFKDQKPSGKRLIFKKKEIGI